MTTITFFQLIIALGIYNVWLLRYNKASPFRGGNANSMTEEFRVYGLPDWSLPVVMVLKLGLATALLLGIWQPPLVLPAAAGMAILMLGAVSMHCKARDPIRKATPAATLLLLCLIIIGLQSGAL